MKRPPSNLWDWMQPECNDYGGMEWRWWDETWDRTWSLYWSFTDGKIWLEVLDNKTSAEASLRLENITLLESATKFWDPAI